MLKEDLHSLLMQKQDLLIEIEEVFQLVEHYHSNNAMAVEHFEL